MFATSLVLAAALVGVETGWQPHEAGGLEYIIQIEPELVASLREGESLTSEVPPQVQGIRRYRIQIGRGPVPRIGEQPLPAPPEVQTQPEPAAAAAPPRDEFPPQDRFAAPPAETYQAPPSREIPDAPAEHMPPLEQSPPPATEPPPAAEQGKIFSPPDFYAPSTPVLDPPPATQKPPVDSAPPVQKSPEAAAPAKTADPPLFQPPQDRYQFSEFNPQPPIPTAPADAPNKTVKELEPPRIFADQPDSMQTTFKTSSTNQGPTLTLEPPAATTMPAKSETPDALGWSFAMLLIVGSMATNLYLAWMWLDTRRRYLSLIYKRSMAL